MIKFRKLNIIGGWVVFAIAFLTYMLTLEPTTSLWDCAEFIATSYKLEVGHPPGTPLFFLINRFGAMFAPSTEYVAYAINALSALESALTIAFMFWSISHLGRRIYRKDEQELKPDQTLAVIAAAAIGSLAYTFTDTFWFSAVEAEVYALSSLFTAVVFWAILKWEEVADKPGSNRWLILISYLMGLSIGAHILNLLAIPALVFIFYFKRYPKAKLSDLWKPGLAAIAILGAFYTLTPTVVSIGAFVDRIFVNNFSLPVNSGLIATIVVILVGLGYGIYRSQKAQRAVLNTILVSATMVVIGFSSYGVVLIRSSVNPPMNSNHPDNPYRLLSFLNREQYGSRPLIYGESYASPQIGNIFKESYEINNGKYTPTKSLIGFEYDPATTMLFPRMYSDKASHVGEYKNWGDVKGRTVRTSTGETVTIPTFGENIRYFFNYQLNYMYWRYFLWNFVGRQSDIQGNGLTDGNWISGIKPIDALYLGPQDNLPQEMQNNKGRNTYFFLPLILGLLGMFFHLRRDGRNFTVVMLLFFMTGLAIILYLNQPPLQPRERDYAYAGSFYAFAIWIGLGVIPVYERFKKWLNKKNSDNADADDSKKGRMAAALAFVVCASVPVVLAVQNWDDHDRSGRTFARDMGFNYLNSTLPNSILINYGDNDTFPVWYAQEVESVRPDVKIMNSSYLGGDWYIDQMRIRSNEAAPVPFSIPRDRYSGNATRLFPIMETERMGGGTWTAKEVMAIVNSNDPRTRRFDYEGNAYDIIPTKRIAVPVNKQNALESGIITVQDLPYVEDTIYINLKKDKLTITEVLMIDLLANFDWKRPLYFTASYDMANFGLLEYSPQNSYSYLQHDGVAYKLVPFKSPISIGATTNIGHVNSDRMYDLLMNQFKYGNLNDPKVYLDNFTEHTLNVVQFRNSFARLADKLLQEGDTTRAIEVLDRAMVEFPTEKLHINEDLVPIISGYWRAGQDEKGDAIAKDYVETISEYLFYFDQFSGNRKKLVSRNVQDKERALYFLYATAEENGKLEFMDNLVGLGQKNKINN